MKSYIKAENLKMKRTLFKKLAFIIPIILIIISMLFIFVGIGMLGIVNSIVCNWCMPFLSISIAIMCHMIYKKDQVYNYINVYSLPINSNKIFIAKGVMVTINLFITSLIMATAPLLIHFVISIDSFTFTSLPYYILGYTLLMISSLWQIPFCFFLEKKVGFSASIIINLIGSFLGGGFISRTILFWFFPYSWPACIMISWFGIQPNGLTVEQNSNLILNTGEFLGLILISIIFLLLMSILLLKCHSKKVRK